jgi:hypothetical protein
MFNNVYDHKIEELKEVDTPEEANALLAQGYHLLNTLSSATAFRYCFGKLRTRGAAAAVPAAPVAIPAAPPATGTTTPAAA